MLMSAFLLRTFVAIIGLFGSFVFLIRFEQFLINDAIEKLMKTST